MPEYKNGLRITASWFKALEAMITDSELEYEITDGQSETELEGQEFDGETISSVDYVLEIIRGTTVHGIGGGSFIYHSGTWKWIWTSYVDPDGVEHGLTFTPSQVDTVGKLNMAASVGPGNGTLKLKRKVFNASV